MTEQKYITVRMLCQSDEATPATSATRDELEAALCGALDNNKLCLEMDGLAHGPRQEWIITEATPVGRLASHENQADSDTQMRLARLPQARYRPIRADP